MADEHESMTLLITAVKDIASLTTLTGTLLIEIRELRSWKDESTKVQQANAVKIADHEQRISWIEGRIQEVRERWHQYALSGVCGVGASLVVSITRSHFGLP